MRLIERVTTEFLPVFPNFLQHFGIVTVVDAALDELRPQLVQNLRHFLRHTLTELVALASREAC